MTDRYPYRHHGPAVHGSKLTDYLVSEVNMIEDISDDNLLLQIDCHGPFNLEFVRRFRALQTRAASAEAERDAAWDEAIEAAAMEADNYMEPHVANGIRALKKGVGQ